MMEYCLFIIFNSIFSRLLFLFFLCQNLEGKGIVPYLLPTYVNNNFPNKLVDQQIKLYIQNINKNYNTTNNNITNRINLYYRNQMHCSYKLYEQTITNIIRRHKPIENKKK